MLNELPFQTTGTSLYVSLGSAVQYRRFRVRSSRPPIRGTGRANYSHWPKTLRRDFVADAAVAFNWALPATMFGQTIAVDVRRCENGIESESTGFRVLNLAVSGGGDGLPAIVGYAIALEAQPLAGGIVVLRWMWIPGLAGVAPTQFRVVRTSGPTSPTDLLVTYDGGRLVTAETVALNDSAPYLFNIVAENGAVTKTVLTAYAVQADASGPPAVSGVTTREW